MSFPQKEESNGADYHDVGVHDEDGENNTHAGSSNPSDALETSDSSKKSFPKSQPSNPFDPLQEYLGIASEPNQRADQNLSTQDPSPYTQNSVIPYSPYAPSTSAVPALEDTNSQRIAHVKNLMRNTANHYQVPATAGFGVDGTNMNAALSRQQYGFLPPQQGLPNVSTNQNQQMYQSHALLPEQQLVLYNSMMNQNQFMAAQNQQQAMMAHQQQLLYHHQMMRQQNAAFQASRIGANNGPVVGVPAMTAERVDVPVANYKVQRATKPTRVNSDDCAFGPILDELKSNLNKRK